MVNRVCFRGPQFIPLNSAPLTQYLYSTREEELLNGNHNGENIMKPILDVVVFYERDRNTALRIAESLKTAGYTTTCVKMNYSNMRKFSVSYNVIVGVVMLESTNSLRALDILILGQGLQHPDDPTTWRLTMKLCCAQLNGGHLEVFPYDDSWAKAQLKKIPADVIIPPKKT